jgi:UDP-glucose:(heptosyl)LPS alpha-1,3-glucosyltransferase
LEFLKFSFCLYKYFPFGGLQRDFMRIALECQKRGHSIRVYCLSWVGDIPPGFDVIIVPVEALTNHTRYKRYSNWVSAALALDPVDCNIGINKMPNLNVYFAADSCYEEKAHSQRSWIYRQISRYKHFAEYEGAVFGKQSDAEILMISSVQKPFFEKYYQTPESRMHFLPPGISRERVAPDNALEIRQEKREELGIDKDDFVILMIGSGFIKKGLNRSLHAIKSLPPEIRNRTHALVVGEDNSAPFVRLAYMLGISKITNFMSGRDDVSELMLAGDVLLHPALDEAAGIVLIEAIVAGLPVLATDVCGYGHYIEDADVGELVSSPFQQKELNLKLLNILRSDNRDQWRINGRRFSQTANIYSLAQEAARIIENVAIAKSGTKGLLAFSLFKYFPFGGLQRDFIRVAEKCSDRGFEIRVYTLSWQGEIPDFIDVVIVPVTAITNHKKYERFSSWMNEHISDNPVVGLVGFNKMPNLDIYYAADGCYEEKAQTQRSLIYRMIPRYKHFSFFERSVFQQDSQTEILMISEVQQPFFIEHYRTQLDRFHLLPPGISRDRMAPENSDEVRASLREEFSIPFDHKLLLMVGSGFITKGLDRILLGISNLPSALREKTHLIAIGQDKPSTFTRIAKSLGINENVIILNGRGDIPRFLLGADLLVHPAYAENTGTVLLEAMVAGLPVLTTDVCGYAHYIEEADAGKIVRSPYQQSSFDALLEEMLSSNEIDKWKQNGIKFGKVADIYSMPDRAADIIAAKLAKI